MLFGAHCSGGIKKAIDRAREIDADALQLFVQSPRAWRFPDHDPADLEAFKRRREELGIQAVTIHALYLLNLASPKDDFYEKSVTTLRSTVDTASAIEADAVVFHVGSHLGSGFETLRLRTFRDEHGRELLDLPRARLAPADAPAPPRLLPRWDELLLAHKDRTRVLPDEYRAQVIAVNGDVRQVILVDGFVAGYWEQEGDRVAIHPFAPLPRQVRGEVEDEARRLAAWLG